MYSEPSTKLAEHGGFLNQDTNVGLLVSMPGASRRTVKTPVATTQVAPTILKALGIDPSSLQSVQMEHTEALPWLP
jgi:arylsulfatase A-like enzyme